MKRRKRFQVRCVLILILSLLLTACESGKSSEKKEEDKRKRMCPRLERSAKRRRQ